MRAVTTSDAVVIAVYDLGGVGPPVVLAHASGFHGRVWRPMAASLATSFHCLSFDLRGHGDSGLPANLDFDWHGFARDVLAVVDGLGLEAPLGVGHSAGGTALLLAEEDRPGTFAALYCYEPVVVPVDPPLGRDSHSWLAAAARKRRDEFGSRREAYDNYASKPPLSHLSPAALAEYVDHGFEEADGRIRLKCRPEHEALVAELASDHDCFSRLHRIACPVMLARGGRSEGVGHAHEAVAGRLPDARMEVLSGLSHFGPMQDPEAVAASIERFFTASGSPGHRPGGV